MRLAEVFSSFIFLLLLKFFWSKLDFFDWFLILFFLKLINFIFILYKSHRLWDCRDFVWWVLLGNLGVLSWWNLAFVAFFFNKLLNFWKTNLWCIRENIVVAKSAVACHGSTVASVKAIFLLTGFSCDVSWIEKVLPCPVSKTWANLIWEELSLRHICCQSSASDRNFVFIVNWLRLTRTILRFFWSSVFIILDNKISLSIVISLCSGVCFLMVF